MSILEKFLDSSLKDLGYIYSSTPKPGAHGNMIKFRVHGDRPNQIVVDDTWCCCERVYEIGQFGELETAAEKVLIVSHDQVKKAWLSGAVWF